MNKYYCDICGDEVIEKYLSAIPAIHPRPKGTPVSGKIVLPEAYGGTYNFDLCSKCALDVLLFIEKKDERV